MFATNLDYANAGYLVETPAPYQISGKRSFDDALECEIVQSSKKLPSWSSNKKTTNTGGIPLGQKLIPWRKPDERRALQTTLMKVAFLEKPYLKSNHVNGNLE